MKTLNLSILLILLMQLSFAQLPFPSPVEIERFYATKTMVVLETSLNYAFFNKHLKEVMPTVWKATPYEFIDLAKYEELKNDSQYSFLMLTKVRYNSDKIKPPYDFLTLTLGSDAQRYKNMPQLCALPLCYSDIEDDEYSYKMPAFLKFIQSHVELLKSNPDLDAKKIDNHYNKNAVDLAGKTIYFAATDLAKDLDTPPEIKQYYDGEIKVVSHDDIAASIKNNEDIVFLHKVGPGELTQKSRCWKLIMGTAGKLYYMDFHIINEKNPDGFTEKDFKQIKLETMKSKVLKK